MSSCGTHSDKFFMKEALKEANKAYKEGEVPVGAVLTLDNKIISRGHNMCIKATDPTNHAEIVCLRKAAKKVKNYRLNKAKLYVTIEPCVMCAGALINARISEIIYGAPDKKAGACGSVMNIAQNKAMNHRINLKAGILLHECRKVIQKFFSHKRLAKNN